MSHPLRIGNASAFWGDDPTAPARLVAQAPDLDFLTLDYLAEVSMSILAKQRQRDPSAGYPKDFLDVVRSLVPVWKSGRTLRLVTNAGGLDPRGCARAVSSTLKEAGVRGLRIGVVSGDDVLAQIREGTSGDFKHLETGESVATMREKLVTANAYLGAEPLVQALKQGADIVVTGRVADPSLTVAPCVAHFGWSMDEWNKLADSTIAGHLIECGTQVTGGISTDWLQLERPEDIGYPIAEVSSDGSCVITKPAGTGGAVTVQTVKEQLLYEIGDPGNYPSPDVAVSFLTLNVAEEARDRVRVSGATGRAPGESHKVSATFAAGYRASGTLTLFGRDAVAKARRCGEIVQKQLDRMNMKPERYLAECIGAGDVAPGSRVDDKATEVVLRISVADNRREVVEAFSRQMIPLVCNGPQGTTGYAEGRPVVRDVFGYWPTLIDRKRVTPAVEILEV